MAQPAPPYGGPPPYGPPGMTTDRPEYCSHLSDEFTAEQNGRLPPPYARILANDGREMCDRGHFRGGIERLRRALVILREGE